MEFGRQASHSGQKVRTSTLHLGRQKPYNDRSVVSQEFALGIWGISVPNSYNFQNMVYDNSIPNKLVSFEIPFSHSSDWPITPHESRQFSRPFLRCLQNHSLKRGHLLFPPFSKGDVLSCPVSLSEKLPLSSSLLGVLAAG